MEKYTIKEIYEQRIALTFRNQAEFNKVYGAFKLAYRENLPYLVKNASFARSIDSYRFYPSLGNPENVFGVSLRPFTQQNNMVRATQEIGFEQIDFIGTSKQDNQALADSLGIKFQF